ncbi:amidohydrolase family protein [Parasphingopyxis algicola]|uniref:amidohydrolase family protein n=1 Tax=Parasphingopyxis algicola TaxID=2026624 RepID=UPI00159F8DFA|nr:amidohydrolase family protein [Parasphingopyxis algicola]QLC25912.1 amidohydrolase family protein [Parasphingopyxis algicola]
MASRFLRFLSIFCLAALAVGPAFAQNAGTRTIIADVTVIPMTGEGALAGRDVAVRGGRIGAVAPHGSLAPEPGDRRVDGRGLFMIPGLWDMHAHLTADDHVRPEGTPEPTAPQIEARVLRRLATYLAHGVTGVRDPGMAQRWLPLVSGLRARPGLPSLVLAGPVIQGPPNPWSTGVEVFVEAPEQAAPLVDALADQGADFVKVYNGIAPDSFAAIAAAAQRRGLPIAGHVPFAVSTSGAIAAGMTQIEHAYVNLFKDCTEAGNAAMTSVLSAWITEGYEGRYRRFHALYAGRDAEACRAFYREMAAAGVFVTPTPQLDLPLDLVVGEEELLALSPAARVSCERALESQRPVTADVRAQMIADLADHLAELRAAGVPLLAGSDAPTDCQGYGRALHRSIRQFVELGLSPREALATATVNPAAMLGRADEGVIRPGARANLVLLGGDPLADIANIHTVAAVMLDGRWVRGPEG